MKKWGLGYEKSKRLAKEIYSRIKQVPCPVFGKEKIFFTNEGFNHLVRKGRVPRTKTEQKRRFALIPYIEQILKSPHARISFKRSNTKYVTNRHGEKILVSSIADFWSFTERIEDSVVRVVIRQMKGGKKHFMSVMIENETNKKPHTK